MYLLRLRHYLDHKCVIPLLVILVFFLRIITRLQLRQDDREIAYVKGAGTLQNNISNKENLNSDEYNRISNSTMCPYSNVTAKEDDNINDKVIFEYSNKLLGHIETIRKDHILHNELFKNGTLIKRLPKCIIVGVGKSGTEEIKEFMTVHPSIVAANNEVDYFNNFITFLNRPGNYKKGPIWYKSQMPPSYAEQITVEKTPRYFCSPEAPQRIYEMNKHMKLILIVREPVARTVSHFTWRQQSYPKKIQYEMFEKHIYKNGMINIMSEFVQESLYDNCMKHWLQYFDLKQLFIVESKEFQYNPSCVLQQVENFLGLQKVFNKHLFVFNEEKGFYCVRKKVNKALRESKAYCYAKGRGRNAHVPSVNATVITIMQEFFEHHNEAFFKMIGRRFDW